MRVKTKIFNKIPRFSFFTPTFYHFLHAYVRKSLKRTKVKNEGISFNIDLPSGDLRNVILGKGHEPAVTRLLFDLLREDYVFWDVGAHMGYYTILAAQKIKNSRNIHSFEPYHIFYTILRLNLQRFRIRSKLNGLYVCNVTDIVRSKISGDQYATKSGSFPDMIKIDIDGGEVEALKGMNKTIRKKQPILFIEVHPRLILTSSDQRENHKFVFNYLRQLGYSVIQLINFREKKWNVKYLESMSDLEYSENYMLLGFIDKKYIKDALAKILE